VTARADVGRDLDKLGIDERIHAEAAAGLPVDCVQRRGRVGAAAPGTWLP